MIPFHGEHIPYFHYGCDIKDLNALERTATAVDTNELTQENIEQYKLGMLGRGSSVGGARPKVLIHDSQKKYIVKFAKEKDDYDNAIVEKACLDSILAGGFRASDSKIIQVNNKNALRVERFDTTDNGRLFQATFNALLKDKNAQQDLNYSSYDAFVKDILVELSDDPKQDYKQMLAHMLFNGLFKNTDDHLRNFSMQTTINKGWLSTPIYDVVPMLTYGVYHQTQFNGLDILPLPSEAHQYTKHFRLTKKDINDVVERVEHGFNLFPGLLEENNISETDLNKLQKHLKF